MSPKEKAVQLVGLYWKSEHQPFNYEHSKRCALIAVDEILLIAPEMHMEGFGNLTIREYYKKVKKEIEKL